ncbi:MAG: hypothetical protein JW870_09640 [Candidatus Delongbacteria bacterium]|nr:hypothetical protein [Candidatus Delongbacteria bacterium]
MSSNYVRKANNFAKKHGIKLEVVGEPTYERHFINDNSKRWIFKMKLSRKGKSYTFNFGQSVQAGKKVPTMYDVLAAVQKYDVVSYENFLSEFGYDKNVSSKKVYSNVVKEYKNIEKLFSDIIDELQEIY